MLQTGGYCTEAADETVPPASAAYAISTRLPSGGGDDVGTLTTDRPASRDTIFEPRILSSGSTTNTCASPGPSASMRTRTAEPWATPRLTVAPVPSAAAGPPAIGTPVRTDCAIVCGELT